MGMTTTGRSWSLTLTAGILAFNGVTTILYASAFPAPLFESARVLVWSLVGAISIAAAVGVFRRRRWGRRLGLVLLAATLVINGLLVATQLPLSIGLLMIGLMLGQAPNAFGIWVLLRRWQGPA
jgi:hypothetical protein